MTKLPLIAGALAFAYVTLSTPAHSIGVDVHGFSQGSVEQGRKVTRGKRRVVSSGHRNIRGVRGRATKGVATTDRACLTADTRAVLDAAERHFNTRFALVSTCRPGAVIAGTRHASQHRYGRAVDLNVPNTVSKGAVVKWLYANAPGVTMIYRGMSHVHFDTGPYHNLACGGCGVRKARTRYAHVN